MQAYNNHIKKLRRFGFTSTVILLVSFIVVNFICKIKFIFTYIPIIMSCFLLLLTLFNPRSLYKVNRFLKRTLKSVILWQIKLVLLLVFILIITPSRFILKILGKDLLKLKSKKQNTYKIKSTHNTIKNMEYPY